MKKLIIIIIIAIVLILCMSVGGYFAYAYYYSTGAVSIATKPIIVPPVNATQTNASPIIVPLTNVPTNVPTIDTPISNTPISNTPIIKAPITNNSSVSSENSSIYPMAYGEEHAIAYGEEHAMTHDVYKMTYGQEHAIAYGEENIPSQEYSFDDSIKLHEESNIQPTVILSQPKLAQQIPGQDTTWKCGPDVNQMCQPNNYCSSMGWCGPTDDYKYDQPYQYPRIDFTLSKNSAYFGATITAPQQ